MNWEPMICPMSAKALGKENVDPPCLQELLLAHWPACRPRPPTASTLPPRPSPIAPPRPSPLRPLVPPRNWLKLEV